MKRFWNKLRIYISAYARPVVVVLVLLGGLVALYSYNIGGLLPGVSAPEAASLRFSDSLVSIRYNPINAPFTLPQHFIQSSQFDSIGWLRAVGAFFGVIAVLAFYRILKHWYQGSVAIIGTILFASSSWLLHTSRLAMPLVLQTLVVLLVLLGVELQKSKGNKTSIFLALLCVVLLFYVPGMLWLLIPGLIWQRRRIVRAIKRIDDWFVVLCGLLAALLIMPLLFAIFVDPALLRDLLSLPAKLPSISELTQNIINVPLQLFLKGPNNPVLWLGRLPLLEIFSAIMFIVGLYAFAKTWLLDRSRMIVGLLIILWALVALGGMVEIAIMLPIVFIVVVNGIAYMLEEWMTTFPRNPLARGVGITLMSLAIATVTYYHLQSYFVAWPNAPETKAAFQLNKPE